MKKYVELSAVKGRVEGWAAACHTESDEYNKGFQNACALIRDDLDKLPYKSTRQILAERAESEEGKEKYNESRFEIYFADYIEYFGSTTISKDSVKAMAKHFYELGLNGK